MAGARPTLTGVTDDASRGGLFVQSNVANPVSGADVNGTVVNDSEITIEVTIDGTTQMGSFRTNQAADDTVRLTFTGVGGDSTGTGGNPVTGGTISADGNTLTLQLTTPPNVDIDITRLATNAELTAALNALNIPTMLSNLSDWPSIGTAGQVLAVNGTADGYIFQNPDTAMVDVDSFSSTNMSVAITPNGADVNLEAQPRWVGNSNRFTGSGSAVTSEVQATTITLGADTGLILAEVTPGNYEIRTQGAAPAPAAAPTPVVPSPTSATAAPTQAWREQLDMILEGTDMVTMVTNVRVTGPSGAITIDPAMDVRIQAGSGEVIIPESDIEAPGNYRVQADVETTSTDGQTDTTMEDSTIMRILPFFQSRNDMTTPAQVTGASASDTEFSNTTGITAIGGTGSTLYLAVLATDLGTTIRRATNQANSFRHNVRFVRALTISLADGTTRDYNIFRIASVPAGIRLANFA